MEASRAAFLSTLAQQGRDHDQRTTERADKLLNITPDTGPFLALLLRAMRARTVLEIGTSNGYSTIWLADAVAPTGQVTTLEASAVKVDLARTNFAQAGVTSLITLVRARAEAWLPACTATYDFIFLDADRSQYVALWPALQRLLAPGGLLVVDNAISHQTELVAFTQVMATTPEVESVLVPLGNGELLVRKRD